MTSKQYCFNFFAQIKEPYYIYIYILFVKCNIYFIAYIEMKEFIFDFQ